MTERDARAIAGKGRMPAARARTKMAIMPAPIHSSVVHNQLNQRRMWGYEKTLRME